MRLKALKPASDKALRAVKRSRFEFAKKTDFASSLTKCRKCVEA